jgi:asparagine synthase (glutamine-hydrolysing)
MCGIAGFVNNHGEPPDSATLERMTAALAHRGPDGDGFHIDGPVALGHRRLAIIDPAGGAQPLSNEEGTVWLTYNGELYNEQDLRPGLEARGHRYKTLCDTETLVHLYEDHGPDFITRLNGMFAFALWDQNRGRLLLARDRMGQKPLYYTLTKRGDLLFASETKALLKHPAVSRELDNDSLARYLFYEYFPSPYSIWKNIHKLPHSHYLTWENGCVRLVRYWSPPSHPSHEPPESTRQNGAAAPTEPSVPIEIDAAANRFWDLLKSAAYTHRRSDVPLGVFLSGGVDSSSVAAALCDVQSPASVHTFSIGFEDPSFDESAHARKVAHHLGTSHHERIFTLESLLKLLPDLVTWLDEPFGDASVLPTHLLSRFAREHVTVALGGDGADELLAGYPTFAAESAARIFRRLPSPARALAASTAAALPVSYGNFSLDFKLKQFLRGAGAPAPLLHQRWLCSFTGREIAELLVNPPSVDVEAEHSARAEAIAPGLDPLSRSLLLYQDTYLPEDILTKVDRSAMAASLEVRAPMLDNHLVDFAQSLPSSYKLRGRTLKYILKRAARSKLPRETLRRGKQGFGIPVARWLRGPLKSLAENLLAPERLRRQGLFRPEPVAQLFSEHQSGTHNHRKPLWTLLIFQLWHEHWVGGR